MMYTRKGFEKKLKKNMKKLNENFVSIILTKKDKKKIKL